MRRNIKTKLIATTVAALTALNIMVIPVSAAGVLPNRNLHQIK